MARLVATRLLILAGGLAAVMLLAADGISVPQPYQYACPPAGVGSSQANPASGQILIPITNGQSEPASAFTGDGQVTVSFNPGTFAAVAGQTGVHISIQPKCPPAAPAGLQADGNAYVVQATYVPSGQAASRLLLPVLLDMRYPRTRPDGIYLVSTGGWTSLGGTVQELLLTIDTRTTVLATFVVGHHTGSSSGFTLAGWQRIAAGVAVALAVILFLVILLGVRFRRVR
jgi:hypothetical protein